MNHRSDFDMNERNIPACGRLIEYSEPHSPFQKLIDNHRKRHGFSNRDLAAKIRVSQSTFWIWLHNLNGFPHPKSFKIEHVHRLSQVLEIPEAKIKSALDASRHLFTPRKTPVPYEAFDPLQRFIEIFENDKRESVSKAYVLHLAKNLHRGSKTTVIAFAALFMSALVQVRADDLVTITGKRYEKVQVTEVTPATIAFTHATGAARIPLAEFGPDVQRKYGYDVAKAKAWLAAQAKAEQDRQQHDAAFVREQRAKAIKNYEEVEQMAALGIVNFVYDAATHRWYPNQEEAQAARKAALQAAAKARFDAGR